MNQLYNFKYFILFIMFFKVNICVECYTPLARKKLPKFAMANNLYLGPIPTELKGIIIFLLYLYR
jgi:hypothetical protein